MLSLLQLLEHYHFFGFAFAAAAQPVKIDSVADRILRIIQAVPDQAMLTRRHD
jgi:hypothetical protein